MMSVEDGPSKENTVWRWHATGERALVPIISPHPARLRNQRGSLSYRHSRGRTTMADIGQVLNSVVTKLKDENYAESLVFYRLWFDIGQTYLQITFDHPYYAIWGRREDGSINSADHKLIHSTADLIVRFIGDIDAKPDGAPAPHTSGLPGRLSTRSLREFFSDNLVAVYYREGNFGDGPVGNFYTNANLIARCANLGYVEEATIQNHILQSLISHKRLYDHQADALIILFKLAGATFEAYADPSVVDRCFELLQGHKYHNPHDHDHWDPDEQARLANGYELIRMEAVQVRMLAQQNAA